MANILILTPTLGTRTTLVRAIQSIQEIGKDKIRHIVIAPQNKIAELQAEFPNTEFMAETGRAKGIYPQLNDGFFKYGRNCDYLSWLNDDDWWLQDFTELIEAVEKDPNLDFVWGVTALGKENKVVTEMASFPYFSLTAIIAQSGINTIGQQAALLKSKLFFDIGGLSENYKLVSDWKLWIDLCYLNPKCKFIRKTCACYALEENRLSSNRSLNLNEGKELLGTYPQRNFIIKFFCKVLFRLVNVHLYLKRFFAYKSLRNPDNIGGKCAKAN